jgi:hypothetical protein
MSKKFTNTDPYRADVGSMWAMLCDQDYWRRKYESMGATAVEFQQFDATDTALTVRSTRNVPADLPGFAKKIIGDTNHVTQSERYTRTGDTIRCQIEIAVKNVPGGTTGSMVIRPTGDGCAWDADLDVKVNIPLVGGKLEGVIHKETANNFVQEKGFNDSWLAGRG